MTRAPTPLTPRVDHRYRDIHLGGGVQTWLRAVLGAADAPFQQRLNAPLDMRPERGRPWIVHLHDHRRSLWLDEYRRARELGATVVTTVHNHAPECPSQSRFLARLERPCPLRMSLPRCMASRYLLRCGRRDPRAALGEHRRTRRIRDVLRDEPVSILVLTGHMRDQLVRVGIDRGRIGLAPTPMVPEEWPAPDEPPAGPPRLLFVGRTSSDKGLSWLLRALARARGDARLDVAGDGDALPDARRLADTLGIAARVTFHGWCDASSLATLRARCWAGVVPSLWHEPAGIVILESLLAGRPVIAARVGGIPELAREGRSALLVPPGDVDALARAIDSLLGDRTLRRRLAHDGRADVLREHTRDRLLATLDETYARALAGSGGGG